MNEERKIILEMLREGKISIDEADSLLDALDETEEESREDFETKRAKHSRSGRSDVPTIDLSEMKEGFREIMKGVESSIRDAVKGIRSSQLGDFFTSAVGSARAESESVMEIEGEEIQRIFLNSPAGDIRISGSEDSLISIHALIKARGRDEEQARQKAEDIQILHTREADELLIHDSGVSDGFTGGYSIDYELRVPREISITVKTTNGDVSVESIRGDLDVSSLSGDIEIKSCNGSMNINTKSGDLNIDECSGEITAKTLSGDVDMKSISSGKLHANSLSGDIECNITPQERADILLRTLSGDVDLRLPESAEVEIEVNSLSGSFKIDLPLDEVQRKKNTYTGVLNSRNGRVTAYTKSGDVHIA